MALANDTLAMAKMVGEGRAVVLKQGQRVQLQEVAIFGGMEKVRPIGETKSWWIDLSHSSKTPVMTNEEKPKEERVARPPSHWRSHYDPPAEAHYVREITDLIAPHMAKQIAKDPDAAAEQARLLIGYTKELAKEGEVTDLQYLEAAKIWAEMGFAPRPIAELMPVFADTLHGSKDAEWTDYDLARIIGEAIRGKQQALESLHLGGLKKVNSNEQRLVQVKQALEKRYKGANRKAKEGGEAPNP
jgi:hypothetical protein